MRDAIYRFGGRSVVGAVLWSWLGCAQAQTAPPLTPSLETLPDAWAAAPVLPLWPDAPPGAAAFTHQPLPDDWRAAFVRNVARPALHVFRPARPDGRALLAIPGGAYQFVSIANEGLDLAARLEPLGITLFVLTYRLPGEGWAGRADVPLQDAQRAMRVIRANARQYRIDPEQVAALGFSAGGHLAATLATEYDEPVYAPVDDTDRLSARPQAVGSIYPVVTMDERPWANFERQSRQPPAAGTVWRANLNRWDGVAPDRRMSIWSDPLNDESWPHVPSRFGELVFVD
jgi:acetyl esterase/lipase